MYEQVVHEVSDPVATITLNRPHALNAWTPRMGAEFRPAVGRAERDRRVVGIVLTGAGKGFCAAKAVDDPATVDEVVRELLVRSRAPAGMDGKDLPG